MDAVADGSVALVVTSPPYFAGKQYEEELQREGVPGSYLEFLQLLTDVFAECVRKLEPGGRIAVNVANLGRKPYRSLSADVIRILQDELGLLLRGELVWRKSEGASGSCAWGSYRSAANPVFRDVTERVVVASKGRFDRALSTQAARRRRLAARQHREHRRLHEPDARRVDDPARVGQARRASRAVPGRTARATHPAVHVRGRPRARSVRRQRLGDGGGEAARPPLRRLRPRPRVHRRGPRAPRRDASASTNPTATSTRTNWRTRCWRRRASRSRTRTTACRRPA